MNKLQVGWRLPKYFIRWYTKSWKTVLIEHATVAVLYLVIARPRSRPGRQVPAVRIIDFLKWLTALRWATFFMCFMLPAVKNFAAIDKPSSVCYNQVSFG